MFKAITFVAVAAFSIPGSAQEVGVPECMSMKGEDVIDTKSLQAECFQAHRGMLEERSAYLKARAELLEQEKIVLGLEKEAREATEPPKPAQQVVQPAQPVVVEPTWPSFVYSKVDPDGTLSANLLYRATGNTLKVTIDDRIPGGGRVYGIDETGVYILWNGEQRLIGPNGAN